MTIVIIAKSYSPVSNNYRIFIIAQAELAEKLSESSPENTLMTNGTTKYGHHYSTYAISTNDGTNYTMDLHHNFSVFAQTTLDTMKEILEDLDMVQQALGEQCNSKRIVILIKNTISYRHAAVKLFN